MKFFFFLIKCLQKEFVMEVGWFIHHSTAQNIKKREKTMTKDVCRPQSNEREMIKPSNIWHIKVKSQNIIFLTRRNLGMPRWLFWRHGNPYNTLSGINFQHAQVLTSVFKGFTKPILWANQTSLSHGNMIQSTQR